MSEKLTCTCGYGPVICEPADGKYRMIVVCCGCYKQTDQHPNEIEARQAWVVGNTTVPA